MNILADRHHAGLFHSLQLLLEDRLGHTVFTPVGHEWWDEGYWRFGEVFGDDRLAAQYLVPGKRTMWDDEFPERRIGGVTLAEARGMDWGAVIATVPENYAGFARFAREFGARFVIEVGNTNQPIDWNLAPLVLNSSEAPGGIHIGQEFDSAGLFGFSLPVTRTRVASMVNLMPRITCWPVMEGLRGRLSDFDWAIHGIEGPDGNLKPASAIADAMRRSGWGYHDKPQGDGFGHVLHGWAAIGRPLIGHRSHYADKRGYIYWRDLETCIDLDRHGLDEAAALIRDISADPERHDAMCRAIRETFDDECDWAADAAAVAGALA